MLISIEVPEVEQPPILVTIGTTSHGDPQISVYDTDDMLGISFEMKPEHVRQLIKGLALTLQVDANKVVDSLRQEGQQ